MNNRVEVPGCVSRRAASKGGTRRDSRTPASGRFGARTRVAFQRVLTGAVLVSAGAALAQYENPSWLTDRQRERHGIPIPGAESAQEALPEVPQCSDTTAAESEPLADALSRWADALQAGLAVDDGGQVLESVYWPEQLRLLRRAALVLGCDASVGRVAAESADTVDSDADLDMDGLPRRRSLREENLASRLEFDANTADLILPQILRYAPELDDATLYDIALAIARACRQHDVDPTLVCALIEVESEYDPHATSSCGAKGLMQLMAAICRAFGVTDPYDVRQNVNAGVAYLAAAIEAEGGDEIAGLARYNGGPRKPAQSWAYAERVKLVRGGVPR